jgi:hypothetical protein
VSTMVEFLVATKLSSSRVALNQPQPLLNCLKSFLWRCRNVNKISSAQLCTCHVFTCCDNIAKVPVPHIKTSTVYELRTVNASIPATQTTRASITHPYSECKGQSLLSCTASPAIHPHTQSSRNKPTGNKDTIQLHQHISLQLYQSAQ